MKKVTVRTLAILIALTLLATATGTSFAATTASSENTNDTTRIQELMDCGLTQKQAEKLVRVEKISKQLEQNGQTLEMDGDKVVIKNSGKSIVVTHHSRIQPMNSLGKRSATAELNESSSV